MLSFPFHLLSKSNKTHNGGTGFFSLLCVSVCVCVVFWSCLFCLSVSWNFFSVMLVCAESILSPLSFFSLHIHLFTENESTFIVLFHRRCFFPLHFISIEHRYRIFKWLLWAYCRFGTCSGCRLICGAKWMITMTIAVLWNCYNIYNAIDFAHIFSFSVNIFSFHKMHRQQEEMLFISYANKEPPKQTSLSNSKTWNYLPNSDCFLLVFHPLALVTAYIQVSAHKVQKK